MTMQSDASVAELFGLAGTFPLPGWVVLDAARDHRFTGELVFGTTPSTRVYFDRGQIYLAERATDPSLGARLVAAGALSAAELERGVVRIGDIEHVGRLFERVPDLDRHTVVVTAELMTEECVGWLASQRVPDVDSTPYRHHESGMHQWKRAPGSVDLSPGDPLPAPTGDDEPVSFAPPISLVVEAPIDAAFLDELIQWDEPAWLVGADLERQIDSAAARSVQAVIAVPQAVVDERGAADEREVGPDHDTVAPTTSDDWVDRLDRDGLPEPDADLLATPKRLPPLPIEPVDRFEIVWPTGEIDEDFGAVASVAGHGHDPDRDRVGATARLSRAGAVDPTPDPTPDPEPAVASEAVHDDPDGSDEVVLAVRRAVASVEVGSLAAGQHLAGTTDEVSDRSRSATEPPTSTAHSTAASPREGVAAPGRVAVRSGGNDWSRRTVTRSVFDEPAIEPPSEPVAPDPAAVAAPAEGRAGALRRLISSLRR